VWFKESSQGRLVQPPPAIRGGGGPPFIGKVKIMKERKEAKVLNVRVWQSCATKCNDLDITLSIALVSRFRAVQTTS
jgi:hypothetical protein